MSVAETITLPAQPATGDILYAPLGGDGWSAPMGMYMMNNVTLAGDVSGGTTSLTVEMDIQFESLIQMISLQIIGIAADQTYRMSIIRRRGGTIFNAGTAFFPGVSGDTSGYRTWNPSAILDAESLLARITNNDGDSLRINGLIYVFQKRASERVPLNILLASLPRAASVT